MKMSGAIQLCLISVYLLAIISGTDKTVSAKPNWKLLNPFTRSPTKCKERCENRHGFFYDENDNTVLRSVSTGKIRGKYICFCGVNKELKNLIKSRCGEWAARKYTLAQLFYLGKQGRKSFRGKGIEFVKSADAKKWFKEKEEKEIEDLLVTIRKDPRLGGPPPIQQVIADLRAQGYPESVLNEALRRYQSKMQRTTS